jgi:phytoene synthase
MTVEACAGLLERGDPDRFAATMATPPALRRILFPLYAFNMEVARAPWLTSEPMIAEMRLQWWRDALQEIGAGGPVRRHEVTLPLAPLLDVSACATLDRLIAARRWDIYKDPFEDDADFARYLDETGAGLMWIAARAAGAAAHHEGDVRAWGRATALANFLRAVPALEAAGRVPLVDGRPQAVADLARAALDSLPRGPVPEPVAGVVLAAWQTRVVLRQAANQPARVAQGTLGQSEFARRFGLLRAAAFGV